MNTNDIPNLLTAAHAAGLNLSTAQVVTIGGLLIGFYHGLIHALVTLANWWTGSGGWNGIKAKFFNGNNQPLSKT